MGSWFGWSSKPKQRLEIPEDDNSDESDEKPDDELESEEAPVQSNPMEEPLSLAEDAEKAPAEEAESGQKISESDEIDQKSLEAD